MIQNVERLCPIGLEGNQIDNVLPICPVVAKETGNTLGATGSQRWNDKSDAHDPTVSPAPSPDSTLLFDRVALWPIRMIGDQPIAAI